MPGYAEQSAEYYWTCLVSAVQGLWQQGARPADVIGVTLTTQRGTIVAVDEEGMALRPAITWLDQRETTHPPALPLYWQALFRAVGATDTVSQFLRQAEANWIAHHEPVFNRNMADDYARIRGLVACR